MKILLIKLHFLSINFEYSKIFIIVQMVQFKLRVLKEDLELLKVILKQGDFWHFTRSVISPVTIKLVCLMFFMKGDL